MNRVERQLRPFRARLWLHRLLEWSAVGLVIGFSVAAAVAFAARLAGLPATPNLLLIPATGVAIAIAVALSRRPTMWDAAGAADHLGLAERVTSALHAARTGHPATSLIEAQALDGLQRVDTAALRVHPDARRLRFVALAAAALGLAVIVPIPALGDRAPEAAERAAIDAARTTIDEIAARIEPIAPEPIVRRVADELSALDEALAESKDIETAAHTIERAQERIASLAGGEQFAARRALDALAAAWTGDPRLGDLAHALHERDADAIDAAIDSLEAALAGLDEPERRDLQLDLQAAANAARDVPDLARALREAAVAAGDDEHGRGLGGGLAAALGDAAAATGSLGAMEGALAGLSQARAGLGAVGALAAASGDGSGSAGAAAVAGHGRGSGGGNSGGTGGSGDGGGQDGDGDAPGGSGAGSGSGSGSGGASGSGEGGGPGPGGGAGTTALAPGSPAGGNATGGPGGGGEASATDALRYESVYAPSLLGGDDGVTGRTPGAATGAAGQTVELPESPLTLGALRPYNEVYGHYEASARQALSRTPLPPNLEALVQAYFGAIRPDSKEEPNS